MEDRIEASAVDFTIARPPRLVPTRDEAYRAEEACLPGGISVAAKMSWRAVAVYLLDAAERHLHPRRVVGLVGVKAQPALEAST